MRSCVASVLVATAAVVSLAQPAAAQETACRRGPQVGRAVAIGGSIAIAETAVILARASDWWPTPTRGFHFRVSVSPAVWQDRFLHGYVSYQVANAATLGFRWACLSPEVATLLGAAVGAFATLPKEIVDGFHEGYGFEIDDFVVGGLGAAIPYLYARFPETRFVSFKLFYWPSQEYRNRPGEIPAFENDYAGQRYYLSFNPYYLPGGGGGWPPRAAVAIGHSTDRWVATTPQHEWYLTVDVAFRNLPIRASWWRHVASVLDQFHLPLPGIRLRQGHVSVGVF